jgi:hypothetical protein
LLKELKIIMKRMKQILNGILKMKKKKKVAPLSLLQVLQLILLQRKILRRKKLKIRVGYQVRTLMIQTILAIFLSPLKNLQHQNHLKQKMNGLKLKRRNLMKRTVIVIGNNFLH